MACCEEKGLPMLPVQLKDLPISTFCCMGRMAYAISSASCHVLLGEERPSWDTLSETQKLELGERAKRVICEESIGESRFDLLFERIIKTMATAL